MSSSFSSTIRLNDENSLESFLRTQRLDFLCNALKELGVVEVSDLRWLSSDIIDTVEVITQMPLIQRRKFENVVEIQKRLASHNDELMKTEQLQQTYCKKFETMKSLLDTNKITSMEFDDWRREEFFKYFHNVGKHYCYIYLVHS